MNAIETHLEAFRWARDLLEMTTADVSSEQLVWVPPGIANPLGATYAHAITAVDAIVQSLLKGEAPLFASAWEGKTGVSQPQLQSSPEWARSVAVDLPALRAYASAVYENAEAYIQGLNEADLDREEDISGAGLGRRTVGWILNALVSAHMHNMVGEISVLKGLQGARGYPF